MNPRSLLLLFFSLFTALRTFSAEQAAATILTGEAGDPAGVVFRVTLQDSSHLLGEAAPLFRDNLLAAADLWGAQPQYGWINPVTGEQEGEAVSTYDRFVIHDRGEFYFVGLRAMKVHGGPLLLSRRYSISPLDLAILEDCGMPTQSFNR